MDTSNEEGIIQWDVEAEHVINDVKPHVQDIEISSVLASSTGVYFNVTTIENKTYCVHLGASGFKVVGYVYNDTSRSDMNKTFESPHALLSTLSRQFIESFGDLVIKKLNELDKK